MDGILDAPGIAIDLGLGDLRARVLSEALAAGGRKQREKIALDRSRVGPRLPATSINGGFSVVERVLAAVRVAPSKTEIREYPMPDVPEDAALMKMEVAGICGTDVKLYKTPPTKSPVIMGHENIGTIAKAGREFTRRKGFKEGDLVFVEHYVACGKCEWCHLGQYRHCENTDWRRNPDAIRYGYTSAEKAPHLWGGFAHYVYLPWNAVVHHVPKGVTPELAGLVT
ncbi:MAG TPA: alcohol dehydrogenase catalytic domain-containing protein, partial [Xanthobacteraceae bacterium]|nr:alcohol dehydrogenase catalytic domain-containing protein [Xanthobacteraceae bacterium]